MGRVALDDVFNHVTALTKMRPRGEGYGVKGSSHVVWWPDYDTYQLGILLGMLYGDGNLIKRSEAERTGKWRIEFCEGDSSLVYGFSRLSRQLFNVTPKVRKRGGWHEAYLCSRIVYEFFTFAGEHPNGPKAGKLVIPGLASRNNQALCGFMCGLFSVEGSVKAGKYLRLTIEMMEPKLLPALGNALKSMGFNPHHYQYPKNEGIMCDLYLYGLADCNRFVQKIGLLGKREEKLLTFLKSRGMTTSARKQPGGGIFRRM